MLGKVVAGELLIGSEEELRNAPNNNRGASKQGRDHSMTFKRSRVADPTGFCTVKILDEEKVKMC